MLDSRNKNLTAACLIYVNEHSLDEFHQYISNVTVHLKRGVSSTASIQLNSFRDEFGKWSIQDRDVFHPWDQIKISAVFGGIREKEIVRGVIREIRIDYPKEMSQANVTIDVQDDLIKLDREQLHGVLTSEGEEKSDGQIAREFADEINLAHSIREEGLTAKALHIESTPIKLLRQRAEINGFELYTRGGKMYFGSPQLGANPQKTIMVYAGPNTNCTQFSVQHDGHKPDQVRLTREPDKKEEKSQPAPVFQPDQVLLGSRTLTSSGENLKPFTWTLNKPMTASQTEAEVHAQAKANENQFKIRATGLLDGSIYGDVLWPYLPVEIDGVGITYGGIYYVDEVTHTFTDMGYQQNFAVIRNAVN